MSYQTVEGIPVWGVPLANAIEQMKNALRPENGAVGGALMADHHLGYAVPVGGVVAYRDKVSPSGVGYDIACGNKAVLTDACLDDVRTDIAKIMDEVQKTISFGVGRNNNEPFDHPLFDDPTWQLESIIHEKRKAAGQLGTVGSGNHYVDIFYDEQNRIWIGVHFGSRGFGHHVATHYIKAGGGKDGINVDPVVLDTTTDLGREYVACMNLAGQYAYAGRDWVCARVAKLLGANIVDEVHNHHNFAWFEGQDVGRGTEGLWIVRKGATPAFPMQRGFVGGTMGENSVILEGVDSDEGRINFFSTVHGAGRVLSRTQAAGRKKWRRKKQQRGGVLEPSGGCISPEMMAEWVAKAGVELRGAGVDESPHCYKRLNEVLAAHGNSIKILHILTPIGVAMAGANEFDPYKD
jgi:tRNA-splicing ligase RtcB